MFNVITNISQPMMELSMIDGINNLFQAGKYGTQYALVSTAESMTFNYISSFIPTLAGQIARMVDPVRRTTTSDKGSGAFKDFNRYKEKLMMKIPGLSQYLPAKVDAFGNEENYNEELGGAVWNVVYQLLSPGYIKKEVENDVTNMLEAVYENTLDSGVFPTEKNKQFSYGGIKYKLTGLQYHDFQEFAGQKTYEMFEEVTNDPTFMMLDGKYQELVLSRITKYAGCYAKDNILPVLVPSFSKEDGDTTMDNWMLKLPEGYEVATIVEDAYTEMVNDATYGACE